jgi:hypothetical protein
MEDLSLEMLAAGERLQALRAAITAAHALQREAGRYHPYATIVHDVTAGLLGIDVSAQRIVGTFAPSAERERESVAESIRDILAFDIAAAIAPDERQIDRLATFVLNARAQAAMLGVLAAVQRIDRRQRGIAWAWGDVLANEEASERLDREGVDRS